LLLGPLWKQSTYALQLQLGTPVKVEYLHITVAVFLSVYDLLRSILYEWIVSVLYQKWETFHANTSRGPLPRGSQGTCLARHPLNIPLAVTTPNHSLHKGGTGLSTGGAAAENSRAWNKCRLPRSELL